MEKRELPAWLRTVLNMCGPFGLAVTLMGLIRPAVGLFFMLVGAVYVAWEIFPWVKERVNRRPLMSLVCFLLVGAILGGTVWLVFKNLRPANASKAIQSKSPEKRLAPPTSRFNSVFDNTVSDWRIKNAPFDLTLHDLFLTDFDSVQQKSMGAIFVDDAHKISVQYAILIELSTRSKFLAFYVPQNEHTAGICAYLAKHYNFVLDKAPQLLIDEKAPGDSGTISTREAIFTKRIYIYHESYLDADTTVRLTGDYSKEGLSVIFRSTDYLYTKKLEYRVRQNNVTQK